MTSVAGKPQGLFSMSLLCSIMAGLFALSAAVQYNDPDPIGWMTIYLLAAIASVLYPRHKGGAILPAVVGIAALAWMLLLLPDVAGTVSLSELFQEWEMKDQRIETAREVGGLALVTLWMAVLAVLSMRRTGEVRRTSYV
jgi:hypothetical protein